MRETEAGERAGGSIVNFALCGAGPWRTEQPTSGYRLAISTDGSLLLQRAYQWQCGDKGGIEWRSEPTAHLDAPPTASGDSAEANRSDDPNAFLPDSSQAEGSSRKEKTNG